MTHGADLIARFYAAFGARDHATMASFYAPDATFCDPVFRDLHGAEIGLMWRMLCERATDLHIEAGGIRADDRTGVAHWEAWYTFSATGRWVNNVIEASFEFRDGLIVRHRDHFSLYRWSRQALGVSGVIFGWMPPMRHLIRRRALVSLARFRAGAGRPSP